MLLASLDAATFRRRYWQRRPLLLKQALPGFRDPLSPEELAGLACEAAVDSRLVFTRRQKWTMQQGPFRENEFTALPDRNWTLLVQAVDQWVPEVRELLAQVPFVPSWRVDDVMVSFATAGGGVGPHFDHYDVFLVQGQGSRVWKTGQRCDDSDLRQDDSGLKLLHEFETVAEWRLECGDVLYVPPGIAHWGVSDNDSLCYSIGFRAPSVGEMLLGFGEAAVDNLPSEIRYRDPPWRGMPVPGEIDTSALRAARRQLRQVLDDELACAEWFGCQMTQPKYPELIDAPGQCPDLRQAGLVLMPNSASRFAWHRHGEQLLVFADGQPYSMRWSPALQKLAECLASPDCRLASTTLSRRKDTRVLAEALVRQGSLLPEEDE